MGNNGLTALTDFPPQEVSTVDRGANKKKRFPIWKEQKMDEEMKPLTE